MEIEPWIVPVRKEKEWEPEPLYLPIYWPSETPKKTEEQEEESTKVIVIDM